MKLIVTGGAGYIGSFMVKALVENGDDVVVIDSLERGKEENVSSEDEVIPPAKLSKKLKQKQAIRWGKTPHFTEELITCSVFYM